jgi:hypothetical protein
MVIYAQNVGMVLTRDAAKPSRALITDVNMCVKKDVLYQSCNSIHNLSEDI